MRRISLCWMLIVGLLLSGCMSTNVFGPEDLYDDNSKDIIVHTTDGRQIEFHSGSYRTIQGDPGLVSGKGRVIVSMKNGIYKDYEGTIGFAEIQNISSTESTPFGNVMGTVAFITVPVVILLLIGMSHANWKM